MLFRSIPGGFEAHGGRIRFTQDGFSLPVTAPGWDAPAPEGRFFLGVRPESLRLVPQSQAPVSGVVRLVEARGPEVVLTVGVGAMNLKVVAPAARHPTEDETVGLDADPAELHVFDGRTSLRRDDLFLQGATA